MTKFDKELSALLGTGFTPQQKQGLYKALSYVLAQAVVLQELAPANDPEFFDVFVDLEDDEKSDV